MLQRLAAAVTLVSSGVGHLHGAAPSGSGLSQIIEVGVGTFLLVGLWTPVMGVVMACHEIWLVFYGSGDPWLPLVLAVLGGSLAIIGPGAWSLDARLFGRKQIKASPR